MAAYKDKGGKWYVSVYYDTWNGERSRKLKRGFNTKREALEWERQFLNQRSGNLDMSFEAFIENYKADMKERLKQSTWIMKGDSLRSRDSSFASRFQASRYRKGLVQPASKQSSRACIRSAELLPERSVSDCNRCSSR